MCWLLLYGAVFVHVISKLNTFNEFVFLFYSKFIHGNLKHGNRIHTVYTQINKGENSALKYLRYRCCFVVNYYSDDEILVIIGDVCSRMGSLTNSTCFTLDD